MKILFSKGLIHTRHFDAQYCDKKDILKPWMSKGQGKLLRNQGKHREKRNVPIANFC